MTVRNTLVHSCRAIMLFSFDQTLTNVVMNSHILLEHCVHTPSLFSVFKRGLNWSTHWNNHPAVSHLIIAVVI